MGGGKGQTCSQQSTAVTSKALQVKSSTNKIGSMAGEGLKALMLIGSAREGRMADRVKKFMLNQMTSRGWEVDVAGEVDLMSERYSWNWIDIMCCKTIA